MLTINPDGSVKLGDEGSTEANQQWKREDQDEVDHWFTLFNPEKKIYLTAETSTAIITTCKNYSWLFHILF